MTLVNRATVAALATLIAAPAFAQTPPAARPAAAPAAVTGPALPGICVINQSRAVGGSTVGQHVGTRIRALTQTVESELQGEARTLETEQRAIQTAQASQPREQLEQRALQLRQRAEAFQRKQNLRSRELQATEQKALTRVLTEVSPVIQQVAGQRQCSILIERDGVLLNNPQMEITDAVITGLNAKLTTFAIERERIAEAPAAAAPGGARPAAPATRPATPPARQ